jgi:hypothetical protein
MIKKMTIMTLPLVAGALITAASAQAGPMCKPANGPLGNLWPAVQSCQEVFPGAPPIPYIRSAPPQTVQYPVNVPIPGPWPFYVPFVPAPLG